MRLLWPFGRTEKRAAQGGGSQGGAGFTDAVVAALLAQAAGGATADRQLGDGRARSGSGKLTRARSR